MAWVTHMHTRTRERCWVCVGTRQRGGFAVNNKLEVHEADPAKRASPQSSRTPRPANGHPS